MTERSSGGRQEPITMVVLGDSFAEGRDDPDPDGGWIGWTTRLADGLGIPRSHVRNLAVEGATSVDTAADQLPRVSDSQPHLVAISCGMNDALNGFDRTETTAALDELFGWVTTSGALALTVALSVPPMVQGPLISEFRRKRVPPRIDELNHELARRSGAARGIRLGPDALPDAIDPRLWSSDGLHLNAAGHGHVADVFVELIKKATRDRPAGGRRALHEW